MPSVTPRGSAQEPDPAPSNTYDVVQWLFADPFRAGGGLIYLVVFLTAVILITWLIGSFLGTIVGTGVLIIRAARWHWSNRDDCGPQK